MNEVKVSWVDRIKTYIKETQSEAKKVSWPSRQYVFSATGIIVVLVLAISFLLLVIDYGLSQAILALTRAR